MPLLQEIDIWEPQDAACIRRYRCLQVLETGRYFVQTLEYWHLPYQERDRQALDAHFAESLAQENMSEVVTYDSVAAAIAAFNAALSPTA